jgi:hypothetical protein
MLHYSSKNDKTRVEQYLSVLRAYLMTSGSLEYDFEWDYINQDYGL